MELWIRSQNKHDLFKADSFQIEDIGDLAIVCKEHGAIGQYRTYERCREILDEIQRLIIKFDALPSTKFYQMPEK